MSLNFSKALMVLVLCLAFVGQALASTVMAYHLSGANAHAQVQVLDVTVMDTSHNMSMDVQTSSFDETAEECCAESCNCFVSGCSTVAALPKMLSHDAIVDISIRISPLNSLAYSQYATSLFRPPILS